MIGVAFVVASIDPADCARRKTADDKMQIERISFFIVRLPGLDHFQNLFLQDFPMEQ
jgi:hypothetical protein